MMDANETASQWMVYLDMEGVLDQDQLDQLTRQLKTEILDQDVETVALVKGDEVPAGSKSAEAITWGALAIEVIPTVLPSLIGFLQSWVNREEIRKVKVKSQVGESSIELEYSSSGIKDDELKDLISILAESIKPKEETVKETAEEAAIEASPEKAEEEKLPEGEESLNHPEADPDVDQAEDAKIIEKTVVEEEKEEKVKDQLVEEENITQSEKEN